MIKHDGNIDYFIRGILEIPIHGVQDPFIWGIWVSASEKSFFRYVETYNDPVEGDGFFGWVCNSISMYPTAEPRPADIYIQTDGTRPRVVLHTSDPELDQLVIDQRHGITIERAQQIAERALHG